MIEFLLSVCVKKNFAGDPDNIEKALKMILEIIKGDPQSSSCLTINYSNAGNHVNHRDEYVDDYGEDKGYSDRGRNGGGGGGTYYFIST